MLSLNKLTSFSLTLSPSFSFSLFLTFALCFVLIGQHAKIGCTNEWNEGAYLRARGAFVLKRSERGREDETLFLVDLGQSSALQRGVFLHGSKQNRRWHIETNQSSPAHSEVQQTNSCHTDLLQHVLTQLFPVVRGQWGERPFQVKGSSRGICFLCRCPTDSIKRRRERSSESAARTYLPLLLPPNRSASAGVSAIDLQLDNPTEPHLPRCITQKLVFARLCRCGSLRSFPRKRR